MAEEQLAEVRLSTTKEVVEKLGLKPTGPKTWVTQERVPHVCSGVERGVRFTASDILEIGRMLPELPGGRRGGPVAGDTQAGTAVWSQPGSRRHGQPDNGGRLAASAAVPSVVDIAARGQLRAHRPRPRST